MGVFMKAETVSSCLKVTTALCKAVRALTNYMKMVRTLPSCMRVERALAVGWLETELCKAVA